MKPGRLFVIAALGWLFLGAAGFFSDYVSLVWLYTGLLLLPVIILDGLILYFLVDRLGVKREMPSSLAQDEVTKVKLIISKIPARKFLPKKIQLWDMHPPSMETDVFPVTMDRKQLTELNSRPCDFRYSLLPVERGSWYFRGLEILLWSFLGFWRLKVYHPCESSGRTYPNFRKIKAAAGMDIRGLLERSGQKNIRMRGQGLEFSSLRDYHDGDSIRAVDWRATSRRQKVIIREYQEEQDQQLLFLLDSGYRLHRCDQSRFEKYRSQFDSALEAVLLLSWVSLKHGDSVGAYSFGSSHGAETSRWISPRKGLSTFQHLMNGLYDVSSSPAPSSPFAALEEALAKLKRRTFIIMISNFREEDGESLSWILRRIEKRHLLLLVSLREKESEALASRQPKGTEEALETAAAFSYLASRRDLYKKWEHSGILTMEASPENLSGALINRYLQVKRSGKL